MKQPGALKKAMPECGTCRFWREQTWRLPDASITLGECRRYPQAVKKDADDGCGEHKS